MKKYNITLTEDEAVVLFEFFARYDDTGELQIKHPAEYIALMRMSGQIDKTSAAMFKPDYENLLEEARKRLSAGFEGVVSGIKRL